MGKNPDSNLGSGIWDEHPRLFFGELRKCFRVKKYLNSLMRIRIRSGIYLTLDTDPRLKYSDLGSGIHPGSATLLLIVIVLMPVRIRLFIMMPMPSDPGSDPTPSFTHVGKSEKYLTAVTVYIVLSFSSASEVSQFHNFGQYIEYLWKKI
jgi:hypothetical protein